MVNLVATFGAIHFYTQWFERLGANPLSILIAGVLALVFALGLWRFNRTLFDSGRHGVRNGPFPGRTEAVHIDVDQPPQLPYEEVDVNAGPPIHVRRILPRQHSHSHNPQARVISCVRTLVSSGLFSRVVRESGSGP